MSVVIYKKIGNKIEIAADNMFCNLDNGFCGKQQKLFKFLNEIVIGHCGSITQMEYINNVLSQLTELNKKKFDYNFFNENCVLENTEYHCCLIFIEHKIFYIKIADGKLKKFIDVSNRNIYGIGYFEIPLGCMLMGATPEEAIKKSSEYNMFFNNEVTKFIING